METDMRVSHSPAAAGRGRARRTRRLRLRHYGDGYGLWLRLPAQQRFGRRRLRRRYGGYGYGNYGGYGSYGGYGGYGGYYGGYDPFGWYGDFYYPGTGIYVYDRTRNRHVWSDDQHRYWRRRDRWQNHGRTTATTRELERLGPLTRPQLAGSTARTWTREQLAEPTSSATTSGVSAQSGRRGKSPPPRRPATNDRSKGGRSHA